MAVLPQSLGRYGGFAGTTGFQLQDTEQQNIAAQGKVQENLLRMQLDAKQREDGANNDLARRNQDLGVLANNIGADTARHGQDLNFQLGMAPLDFAKQKYNTLLPMLQSQLGAQGAGLVGGQNTPQPAVTPGGVFTPDQIQQQVNASKASVDRQTATSQRGNATKLAGQGFSPKSPLLAALNQQAANAGMASGADQEREIRMGAAGQNAQHMLAGQNLAETQWRDFNDADIRRRQAAQQGQNSILSILASLA
jgi:hypothetical protein